MAHAESSSYEHLRERVAALRNELAMAEQVLALREEEKRKRRDADAVAPSRRPGRRRVRRAEATALVTRVALRRAAVARRKDLARMLVVGIMVSMATAALVVLSVRALDARGEPVTVAQPLAKLRVPPLPAPLVAPVVAPAPVPPPPVDVAPPARAPAKVQSVEPRPTPPNPYGDDELPRPKTRSEKWGF